MSEENSMCIITMVKIESYHDANFVMTISGATSDDKVGFMETLHFHCRSINSNPPIVKSKPKNMCNKFGFLGRMFSRLVVASLTHLPLVPHVCVGELGFHWLR